MLNPNHLKVPTNSPSIYPQSTHVPIHPNSPLIYPQFIPIEPNLAKFNLIQPNSVLSTQIQPNSPWFTPNLTQFNTIPI